MSPGGPFFLCSFQFTLFDDVALADVEGDAPAAAAAAARLVLVIRVRDQRQLAALGGSGVMVMVVVVVIAPPSVAVGRFQRRDGSVRTSNRRVLPATERARGHTLRSVTVP